MADDKVNQQENGNKSADNLLDSRSQTSAPSAPAVTSEQQPVLSPASAAADEAEKGSNKPLSPEEIAALLASSMSPNAVAEILSADATQQEEIQKIPAADGPMSPDEVAAFLAALEQPESTVEKPTEVVTTVTTGEAIDPNKPMSPDDIAALLASMDEKPTEAATTEAEASAEPAAVEAPAEPVDPNKPMSPDDIAALLASMDEKPAEAATAEAEASAEPAAIETPAEPVDPNKPMSPDDIAALLASMDEKPTESATTEAEASAAPAAVETPAEPLDPNKPMSPDDIAALLASMDEKPAEAATAEAAAEPAAIETPAEPVDPNKPMSPDDIAALLASMDEKPAEAATTEAEAAAEPAAIEASPEPVDPNKQMSPDDIAALLASMDEKPAEAATTEAAAEPAAVETPAEPVDPNKQMSPDDIAALLTSMDEKPAEAATTEAAAEPAALETPAEPVDPNKQMSPDDIAALLASMDEKSTETEPVQDLEIESLTAETAPASKESAESTVPAEIDHWEIKEIVNTVIASHEAEQAPAMHSPAAKESMIQRLQRWFSSKFAKKSATAETEIVADNNETSATEGVLEDSEQAQKKKRRIPFRLSKRAVLFIVLGFISVAGIGGLLGYQTSKFKHDTMSPLDKIVNLGVTFEEKSMVQVAAKGDKTMIKAFIDAGMDVNAVRKSDGWTPLMSAAFFKQPSIVQLLIAEGANLNLQDNAGRTALMNAANVGAEDIVHLLLDNGANPNIQDKFGRTALSDAYRKNESRIAELLKAAGADPNIQPETRPAQQSDSALPPGFTAGKGSSVPTMPSVTNEYALSVSHVGGINIGMSLEDLQKKYSNVLLNTELIDGEKKTLAILYLDSSKKTPALKMELSNGKVKLISTIHVYDPRYKTDKQIGSGSSVDDIRSNYAISDVRIIDGTPYLVVKSMRMMCEMDVSADSSFADWFKDGTISSLPGTIKVKQLLLY